MVTAKMFPEKENKDSFTKIGLFIAEGNSNCIGDILAGVVAVDNKTARKQPS